MSTGKTIVSYRNITQPFRDVQTQLARTRDAAGQVIPDAATADARVSDIQAGFDALREAQGSRPQVMHTPRNVAAALLQSHVARNAVAKTRSSRSSSRAWKASSRGSK